MLTTEEVAELMRVERPTVLRWASEYGLKILSIGPRIKRIRREDLREFLLTSDELQ
jgi:excisionase family DNA binding protein